MKFYGIPSILFFCISSNFGAFFKRSKWDVKDYTRLHYRVVYCTFYVRRIISSSLRGRRREYCVVKRIIIKTIGYDNLEYLEIFSNKGKKERKTFEIGQFNSNSLKSLILSSKLSFVYYNYDYNYS